MTLKPHFLRFSNTGSSYVSGELAEWLGDKNIGYVKGVPYHPQTQDKIERWHQTLKNQPHPIGKLLLPGRPGSANRGIRWSLQSSAIPREHQQPHFCWRLLRARPRDFKTTRKDQTENHRDPALAIQQKRRLILSTKWTRPSLRSGH